MNNRQSKKIRKLYRRDYHELAKDFSEYQNNLFKPKPKWIPWFIYTKLLGLFIRIKK